ncbi:uncharacterized protein BX664DRAFT_328663 [Halteromyces radiatus]|uniref:uncharacterized protein n=1 Tax=Halteromyces radiatus TaxID=101107 RepID=UPI00221E9E2F|nr:uncharacterized protein BX664DRAFT_328663 [Halteromyces radiatus]KAI8092989.1 hypothetical protein BX664DRAFT_328663 [Halteromyces radiatus]
MAERDNPKTYYNQAEYTGAAKTSKPDDTSYPPPPPYSNTQPGAPSSSSSAYSPSAPPSTYASAQEYPSYGSLDPNRPGLLDSRTNPYSSPLPRTSPQQHYPYPGIPDVNSTTSTPTTHYNPHIPRDWIPDGGYNKSSSTPQQQSYPDANPSSPRSRINIPEYARQAMDNSDPGCCKKWCKYILVALLIWLVILKYSGTFQFDTGHHNNSGQGAYWECKGKSLVSWTDLPNKINVEQDLFVIIKGPVTVSNSYVNIHPASDRDVGWIESHIMISPPSLVNDDELYYQLEQQDDETRLVLHLPPWDGQHHGHERPCVQVKMDIYLPDKIKSLRVNVNNMPIKVTRGGDTFDDNIVKLETDRVELSTTNSAILFDTAYWEGDTMSLTTTNGPITISGNMEADEWIHVQSSNGHLVSAGTMTAKDKIELTSTNSKISTQSLIVKDILQVSTTNGAVQLGSRISGDHLLIRSTNGALTLPELVAESSLTATTTNAAIVAHVIAEKDPKIRFSTTNAHVSVKMVISNNNNNNKKKKKKEKHV